MKTSSTFFKNKSVIRRVIPAQAGIQTTTSKSWIPAGVYTRAGGCGMTKAALWSKKEKPAPKRGIGVGKSTFSPPLIIAFIFFALFSSALNAQIRSGASFLKIIPGARQHAMAGSLTGVIDNAAAIYANPGAAGFLREWHWNLAYSSWAPGVYNASAMFARRLTTPWSNQTRFALSASFLGVKEFDSSGGRAPTASGGDYWIAASVGQPLKTAVSGLSFGASIKYLNSRLSDFKASTFAYDAGLLFRTARFNFLNGAFKHGVLSAGLGLTQNGAALNFVSVATPLPRTFRSGLALHLGSHENLQTHFSLDYKRIRDEDGFFSLGAEFSIANLLSMRLGYTFENSQLLRRFNFGFSIGLNDVRAGRKSVLPGRNKAIRIDLAAPNSNDFFAQPYNGSVNHYTIRPERFEMRSPALGANVPTKEIQLQWSASRDPDVFDDVLYWLLVDEERVNIEEALAVIESAPTESFFASLQAPVLALSDTTRQTSAGFVLPELQCKTFYWSVVAVDKDRHFRVAKQNGSRISNFSLALPDLEITSIDFAPKASNGYGVFASDIVAQIQNSGTAPAGNVTISIYGSRTGDGELQRIGSIPAIRSLAPGETEAVTFVWPQEEIAARQVVMVVDEQNFIPECNEDNNRSARDLPTTLTRGYDLSISKAASQNSVFPGDTLTYALIVRNDGPFPAYNIAVEDAVPSALFPYEYNIAPNASGDTLKWQIEALQVGESFEIRYDTRVKGAFAGGAPEELSGVNFELGKAVLTLEAQKYLDDFATQLRQAVQENPNAAIEIRGHTDSQGAEAYNQTLSQARAESVKNYLVSKDTTFSILTAKGYGESQPIAPNDTPECRAKNRRVEMTIPETQAPAPAARKALVNRAAVWAGDDSDPTNNFTETIVTMQQAKVAASMFIAVNFDFDQAALTAEAKTAIENILPTIESKLRGNKNLRVEIAGHTDGKGSDEYNLALSKRRAEAVLAYLGEQCLRKERLSATGYGEGKPIADNETEAGRKKNRRVEIKFIQE